MKLFRNLAIGVFVIALLVPLAAYITLELYGTEKLKPLLIQAVKKQTGHEFDIAGEMHAELNVTPTIAVYDVHLANADWAKAPSMVHAEKLSVTLDLLELVEGRIAIANILVRDAKIALESKGDQHNWVFEQPAEQATAEPSPTQDSAQSETKQKESLSVAFESIALEQVSIDYQKDTESYHLDIASMDTMLSDQGFDSNMRFRYQGVDGTISAHSDAHTLQQLQELPMTLVAEVTPEQSSIIYEGTLALTPELAADGTLVADIASLHQLNALAGRSMAASEPIILNSQIKGSAQKVALKLDQAAYGDISVDGMLHVDLSGSKPYVSGTLHSALYQLPADSTNADTATERGQSSAPAPAENDAPLPFDALHSANADIELTIDALKKGDTALARDIYAKIALANGVLRVPSYKLALFEGTISGDALIHPKAQHGLNAKMVSVDLAALSNALIEGDPVRQGTMDMTLALRSSGNTTGHIMNHLSGNATYELGETSIVTPESAGELGNRINALRGKQTEGKTMDMRCAAGKWVIGRGQATSRLAIFDTEAAVIDVSGEVGLANGRLDLLMQTYPYYEQLTSLSIPLEISGSVSKPSIKATPKATIQTLRYVGLALAGKSTGSAAPNSLAKRLGEMNLSKDCLQTLPESLTNPKALEKEDLKSLEDTVKSDFKQDFKKIENDVRAIRDLFKK